MSLIYGYADPASAEGNLEWAGGVGMAPCRELASVDDQQLHDWVFGYWTGANLYLGGTDLCLERAAVSEILRSNVRPLIEVQCAPIKDAPIMMAAFNALKGLPKVAGSRAAACGGN